MILQRKDPNCPLVNFLFNDKSFSNALILQMSPDDAAGELEDLSLGGTHKRT